VVDVERERGKKIVRSIVPEVLLFTEKKNVQDQNVRMKTVIKALVTIEYNFFSRLRFSKRELLYYLWL
jgi:hypothetical protein